MKPGNASPLLSLLIMICLAALLTACATAGKSFPGDKVKEIEIGTTTKGQVLATFGEPWRTGWENGYETWTYGRYKYSAFKETVSSDLVVRFKDGVVHSYSYSTTNPKALE